MRDEEAEALARVLRRKAAELKPAVKLPRAIARKPRERKVEKECCDYAKWRGCLALKMDPRRHIGIPDRLFVLPNGRTLWVEFKRPGKTPTEIQWARIIKLQKLGQSADWFDDYAGFRKTLDRLLGQK